MASTSSAFDLIIEISGLCLFVVQQPKRQRVAVLMPDARFQDEELKHPDDEKANDHVGYLRFDLGNLDGVPKGFPVADFNDVPSLEVVHQFDREELEIELPDSAKPGQVDLRRMKLPDFDVFATVKEPKPGLFAKNPPDELLMRTVLEGGSLTSILEPNVEWEIDGELNPKGTKQVGILGGEVRWRRTLKGPGVVLRIKPFGSRKGLEIPLRPKRVNGRRIIALKLANLCASNPLEWPAYKEHRITGPDEDFKWMYKLLKLRDGYDPEQYTEKMLPHPRPRVVGSNQNAFQDCFGGTIGAGFGGG